MSPALCLLYQICVYDFEMFSRTQNLIEDPAITKFLYAYSLLLILWVCFSKTYHCMLDLVVPVVHDQLEI